MLRAGDGGAEPAAADAGRDPVADRGVARGRDEGARADRRSTAATALLGRTAYRVVQEGLTNARKHAPAAAVEVTVGRRRASSSSRSSAAARRVARRAGAGRGHRADRAGRARRAGRRRARPRPEPARRLRPARDAAVAVIRVLLVDDDALVRSGLRMMLAGAPEIEVVGEAERRARACSAAVDLPPARRRADGHPDAAASTGSRRRGCCARSRLPRP